MTEARANTVPAPFDPWQIALMTCLLVLTLLFITPIVGVVLSAFKTSRDISLGNFWSVPWDLYMGNFAEIFGKTAVQGYMVNTLIIAVSATAGSIALSIPAGWVFAKIPFRSSEYLFLIIVSGLFFPPQIVLIPLFKLFKELHLIDTLWALIIAHTAHGIPICVLLMRNFFANVPRVLHEAALAEGVNEWQILTRIALPMSLPAVAVLTTLQFTWIWNDFLWALIFTNSDDMRTIMVGLVFLNGKYLVAFGVQGAMALLATLPTLIVFLFFQRYFIAGLTAGGVKG